MTPLKTTALVAAILAAGGAIAQGNTAPTDTPTATTAKSSMPSADASFLKDVAQANHAEIEAAKLAQSKAKSADVKSFATQMADDHAKAQEELQKLADAKGVKLPDGPSMMQKAKIKLISAGDDAKFDERYTESFGVKAHDETVKMFEKEAAKAKDADVKAFAEKMLPTLKHHQSMASTLEGSVKPTAAGEKGGKTMDPRGK